MTTIAAAPNLMTLPEIEAELATIREEHRQHLVQYENRDFEKEAREAHDDPTRGLADAAEIQAIGTLYRVQSKRRVARIEALEAQACALRDADVTDELEALAEQHAQAVEDARNALEAVPDLADLEQSLSCFSDAQHRVRDLAVQAGEVAKKAGFSAPELPSVYSQRLAGWYVRLGVMQTNTQVGQGVQHNIDRSRFGVPRMALD